MRFLEVQYCREESATAITRVIEYQSESTCSAFLMNRITVLDYGIEREVEEVERTNFNLSSALSVVSF